MDSTKHSTHEQDQAALARRYLWAGALLVRGARSREAAERKERTAAKRGGRSTRGKLGAAASAR